MQTSFSGVVGGGDPGKAVGIAHVIMTEIGFITGTSLIFIMI
jgi:hypothetical protein